MQYLQRLATGVNVLPLAHALVRQPHLWNGQTFRTTYTGTPHAEADDIVLRFSDTAKLDAENPMPVTDDERIVWHPAAQYLPEVKPLVMDLMKAVGAYAMDRLLITRLRPGKRIAAHSDNYGAYVQDPTRVRYHLIIQGGPKNFYRVVDETVAMQTGEVWWFDALSEHECLNDGDDDRIHLLIDLRTWPNAFPG